MANIFERGRLISLAAVSALYLGCARPPSNPRVVPTASPTEIPLSTENSNLAIQTLQNMKREFPECIIFDVDLELQNLSQGLEQYNLRVIQDTTSQEARAFAGMRTANRQRLQDLAKMLKGQSYAPKEITYSLSNDYTTMAELEAHLATQYPDNFGQELEKYAHCHLAKVMSLRAPYELGISP